MYFSYDFFFRWVKVNDGFLQMTHTENGVQRTLRNLYIYICVTRLHLPRILLSHYTIES